MNWVGLAERETYVCLLQEGIAILLVTLKAPSSKQVKRLIDGPCGEPPS